MPAALSIFQFYNDFFVFSLVGHKLEYAEFEEEWTEQ
jgi:hypothetical protein